MSELFLKIIVMSISASWLVLAVLILRLVLKKAPKWMNVLLWGIVAVRLICPFTIESPVSMIPDSVGSGKFVSEWMDDYVGNVDIHHSDSVYYDAAIGAGREPISDGEGGYYVVTKHDQLGEPATIKNTVVPVLSVMWVAGITVLAFYTVISFWRLRRKVNEAVIFRENIYLSENVCSPFVLGIIKPKIYLPFKMDDQNLEHIIAHEKAHIRRKDHWWKPFGFLLLTLHWFNPLMWIAYVLLCRDIELACDEKVIRQMDLDGKKRYSTALLECNAQRRLVTICPLAFGEVGVKERVKNVLNYKKPAFWLIVVAIIACGVVTVCFATNPKQELPQEQRIDELRSKYPEYFDLITSKGLEVYVWQLAKDSYSFGLMPGTNREKTLEELMSLKGASAAEMALILSTYEIEDENIFVIPWGNPISSYMVGTGDMETPEYINNIYAMLGLEGSSGSSMVSPDMPITVEPDTSTAAPITVEPDTSAPALSDEQTAVHQAIMAHNKSSNPQEYDTACCSFIALETLSGTPLAGSSTHKITCYGWALYEEYKVTDNGLETTTGSHVPVAITFREDPSGALTLEEYWQPRDGSYFAQDIREKFPAHIVEDALHGQKFVLQQTQECYAQAIAATGLDANQVIGSLIETICSSPALSSNPGDYIEAHPIEYRELTYYGRYTLKYCFARFEEGNETGLDGHIMMQACEDIAASWGEALLTDYVVITGQVWYDAFKSNALGLMEQYAEIELAERYPMSYLLLSMLGKV